MPSIDKTPCCCPRHDWRGSYTSTTRRWSRLKTLLLAILSPLSILKNRCVMKCLLFLRSNQLPNLNNTFMSRNSYEWNTIRFWSTVRTSSERWTNAGFLLSLTLNESTSSEMIATAAEVMRTHSIILDVPSDLKPKLIDVVGNGWR